MSVRNTQMKMKEPNLERHCTALKLIPLTLFQIGVKVGHVDMCMGVFSYILPTAQACTMYDNSFI